MRKVVMIFCILLSINLSANVSNNINISNAAIRLMPPMMKMTAAFMDIHNKSSKNVTIVNVSSNLSEFTEMHTHKIKNNGTAVMTQLNELNIKANSTHSLKKGGDHIMFIGLKEKLSLGASHKLTLHFSDGSKKDIFLEVKKF